MTDADDSQGHGSMGRLELVEPRQPPITRAEFTDALSHMASTVTVVAASHGGERHGRTVTAVFSLNASPPSVLVSIDLMSPLADLIVKARGFSVSLLAEGQETIGDAFAGKVARDERFGVGAWDKWPSGQPLLEGCMTALDCELIGVIDAGTHMLFAGGIIHTQTSSARPLIWQARGYRKLER